MSTRVGVQEAPEELKDEQKQNEPTKESEAVQEAPEELKASSKTRKAR